MLVPMKQFPFIQLLPAERSTRPDIVRRLHQSIELPFPFFCPDILPKPASEGFVQCGMLMLRFFPRLANQLLLCTLLEHFDLDFLWKFDYPALSKQATLST